MTNQQFGWLLTLCLIVLLLQLVILFYLLKKCLPRIPKPTIRLQTVTVTPAEPTNEEEIYDEVFVQQMVENDGYFSESALQASFFQGTDTSDQATASTEGTQ